MKRAISIASVSILLISSIFIGLVNFAPTARAETGGPHDDGVFPDLFPSDGIWTTNGDWVIEPGDDISHADKQIMVNGNLFVNGSLTLTNVDLYMDNATRDGEYNITVLSNGNLTIKDTDDNPATTADASRIMSNTTFRFGFQAYPGSRLELRNSELYDCGWSTSPYVDGFGLFIYTNWANVTGSLITDSYCGAVVWYRNNVTIDNNTINNIELYGVYTDNAAYCYLRNNTLSSIQSRAILIYDSIYLNVSYNNVVNNPNAYGISLIREGGHDVYANTIDNNQIGVFVHADGSTYSTLLCDIFDNEISNNDRGIQVQGLNALNAVRFIDIYENEIYSNNDYGIMVYGENWPFAVNNVYIFDNIIRNNGGGAGHGIRASIGTFYGDAGLIYCYDNEVRDNSGSGYYLDGASYVFIENDYIARNDINLDITSADHVYVTNTTFEKAPAGDDIIIDNGYGGNAPSVYLLNTTFDRNSATVSDTGSFLDVERYLHVRVVQWGMGAENALVWVNDTSGNPDPPVAQPFSTGTGNDGWIRGLEVRDFNRTSSATTDYTPHHIDAWNVSANGSATVTMNSSREVQIFLNSPPSADNISTPGGFAVITRGQQIKIHANGSDPEDSENILTPYFQYSDPNVPSWNTTYLDSPTYMGTAPSGFWQINFTTAGNAPLGLYNFRVRFEDPYGSLSGWKSLILANVQNNPPTANAGANDSVSAGSPYYFNASNSTDDEGIIIYEWDIDESDGLDWVTPDLTGISPNYTYLIPGVYNVTLRVEDAQGEWDLDMMHITVIDNTPPVADAGPDDSVMVNTPYVFDASGSSDNVGIIWYNWSFGDGSYDNGTNIAPSHIYAISGLYTATLNCSDARGNWDTDTVNITVVNSFPPVAIAGPDNSTDEDSSIVFNGSDSSDDFGIIDYYWDIDISDGLDWITPDLIGMEVFWTYTIPGDYIVTLRVEDADGGWDTAILNVTVYDITPPVANAGPADSTDEDTEYIFDGSGSFDPEGGTIVLYSWYFGDGYYSNGTNPQTTHTYTRPGNYTVVLNVTDSTGLWDTDSVIITVLDTTPPVADAGAGQNVDEGSTVFFDASVSFDNVGIITYYWDMDDSDGLDWVSPDQMGITPVHVYSMPKTYTVTLNCTDAAGNSGYAIVTIVVNDITNPAANAGPDDSVNEDNAYSFDGSGSSDNVGITSYKWDIDSTDGVDWLSPDYTVVGPSHIYSQPRQYVATLRVEDAAGNWATDTVTITVNDVTDPIADAGTDDTVNHGTPKTFDGTGSSDNVAIYTYEWDIDASDGVNWVLPDYTGSTPTHNYAQPGLYTATLRVTDTTGNWAIDTVVITVVDITDPTANAGPDDSVNEDALYQFDGSGSTDDVGIVDYAWDIDNSDGVDWVTPDYTGVDPSHNYTEPGVYYATLRVEDGDGNWDTDTVMIDVLDITDPTANAGSDTTIDEDSPYQFDGSLSTDNSGTIAFYNWNFDDGTYTNGTDPQPYHTFAQLGIYIVTLTVIDAAGNSKSDTVQITVLDVTDPSADAGPDDTWDEDSPYMFDGTGSSDNSGSIASYKWDFGDGTGTTDSDPRPMHTYVQPGIYTVTLNVTDAGGNSATDTMVITVKDVTDPAADAGFDDSVNEDASYMFDASASTDNVGIMRYAWDIDDRDGLDWATPDKTGMTPSFVFPEPGVYIVTLNITDLNGNWATDTVAITVIDITPPTADAGPDGSLDEDLPYTFDGSGSHDNFGIASFMWDVDDSDGLDWGNPDYSIASPTHTFTEPGFYTVTLNVSDTAGNWALDTVVIEVIDITSPSIFVEYADPMNEDVSYLFNATASHDNGGVASFNFSFGDGFYRFGSSPTAVHTYENPGTYLATLAVTDFAGNSATVIFEVTVLDTTAPSTPARFAVTKVEEGEALNLTWLAVTDSDLHHYGLYFSEDGINFDYLDNLTAETLSFTHKDLTNGETYYYYITAVDIHGLSSEPSDVVSAAPDRNFDRDAEFDLIDEDDDNDGVDDEDDLFPYNPNEWADFDGDGIGDNTDDDDDGDGVLDVNDDLPFNPDEVKDSDGDGLGDNEDLDDDNDGIFDTDDAFPYDPEKSKEPTDLFTYLLLLIIIIALIIAAVLGAWGSRHKRQSRDYERKILEMEKAQAQVPPPAAAPAPPPWLQAKTRPTVPPPSQQVPSVPPPKPPVKEEPAPSELEPAKTAELISEDEIKEPKEEPVPSEKPSEPEEEIMIFEAVEEEEPQPPHPPTKSAETAKPEGEAEKPRPPRPPTKSAETAKPEGEAEKPRPPRPPKKKKT